MSIHWNGGDKFTTGFLEDRLLQFLLADKQADEATFSSYYDRQWWPAYSKLIQRYAGGGKAKATTSH
ncbi:hypothetical protein [Micromonospora chersina]|uniref:hypothetical protein n=1 Tax=Micromonospora chersina TaxID=47854 RepID=UPI0034097D70